MTGPTPITRDGAAGAARRELSKAIYHRGGDPLPVRVVHAIGRFIDHLLSTASKHTPGGGWGALILLAVIAIVVGLVIWRAGPPARSSSAMPVLLTGAAIVTADEHRRRSIRAEAGNDWHTAVIERMRAIAREVEERGVIDSRPGRTATELAADAGSRVPGAAAALVAAAKTFNAVAYGNATAGTADLATVVAADDALLANTKRLVAL